MCYFFKKQKNPPYHAVEIRGILFLKINQQLYLSAVQMYGGALQEQLKDMQSAGVDVSWIIHYALEGKD